MSKRNPYADKNSIEFKFRSKRFEKLQRLLESILAVQNRARILDMGGTESYWLIGENFLRKNEGRIDITLVNTRHAIIEDTKVFTSILGDAADTNLFHGERFDLVHSNSVIEHVGSWDRMRLFAENITRLSDRYFVQTPNYWFPYEPHFRFPCFQYLPKSTRVKLIMAFPLGFYGRISDLGEARRIIDTNFLISERQMRELFNGAEIFHEKFLGLNKSIVAIKA
jgi:hypothetical protein